MRCPTSSLFQIIVLLFLMRCFCSIRFLPVPCVGGLQDPTNNCAVTPGRLTLFLDEVAKGETEAAISVIQKGQYNSISNSIVRVSFLADEDVGNNTSDAGAVSGKSITYSAGLPIWAYVLIALGALLLVGLTVFFLRRGQASRTGKRDGYTGADLDYRDESMYGYSYYDDSYEPPDDHDESDDGRGYRV